MPQIMDYSVAEKQDFKVRLANVKLKDVDLWGKEVTGWHYAPKRSTKQAKFGTRN